MIKQIILLSSILLSVSNVAGFVREINIENEMISIQYNFGELEYDLSENDSTKIIPKLSGLGSFTDEGLPLLPRLSESFEIPTGYNIQDFTYLCDIDTISINKRIDVAVAPATESSIVPALHVQPVNVNNIWPNEFASLLDTGIYRDVQIASFELAPVKFDSGNEALYFSKNLTIKITLSHSPDSDATISTPHISIRGNIDNMTTFKLDFPTTEEISTFSDKNIEKLPSGYLIICPKKYEHAAQKLASWKRRLGFNATVIPQSDEICHNPETTRNNIRNLYLLTPELEYVLLLGSGEDIIPFEGLYNVESSYSYYTDYYFGCMDGEDDILSDLKIGRMPAQSLEEALIMVNKTIGYEKTPPAADDDYYNKATHAAFFEPVNKAPFDTSARRFVLTSEDILNYMTDLGKDVERIYTKKANANPKYWSPIYSHGNEIPAYLQLPNFQWNGTCQDLISSINEGRFYILYRGHGAVTGFGNIGFYNTNVSQLYNIDRLPVVFGITCLSGTFYHPVKRPGETRCIAETLLASNTGGAVAVIAACRESYSGYNEHFTGGLFNSIFPKPGCVIDANMKWVSYSDYNNPERDLGSLLNRGSRKMFEAYRESMSANKKSYARYNMEIFHCIGDPSLKVYSRAPQFKLPIFLCEGGQDIYLDSERDAVLVNKQTNEVSIFGHPIRLPLGEYLDDYYVSLVSDNTVPLIFNQSEIALDYEAPSIKSLLQDKSNCIVTLNGDYEGSTISIYDIYGQRIDSSLACDNIVKLQKQEGYVIVTLSKDGVILDKKASMIK